MRIRLTAARKVVYGTFVIVGAILTWSGWTGPEFLDRVAAVPWLSFFGSDWFRTVLVLLGLGLITGITFLGFRANPASSEVVESPAIAAAPEAAASGPTNHAEVSDDIASANVAPAIPKPVVSKPVYSHSELVTKREKREFLTQQLTVAEAILHSYGPNSAVARVTSGLSPMERKWIWETYLGLRDLDPAWADWFGHPDHFHSWSISERVDILKTILEVS